jgi:uncharacterized Tic20 family protein
MIDHDDSPENGSTEHDSPVGGSPVGGSPAESSPVGGSPAQGSPAESSPLEKPRRDDRPKGMSESDERMMAMFCHLGGIIGGFVVPLIIWLIKKEESKYIDYHGKEALNFQITMGIAQLVCLPLAFCTFGLSSLAVLAITIVFAVLAGTAANRGERYSYPMTFRFIQ